MKTAWILFAASLIAGCAAWVPGRQAYWDAKVREMCAKDGGTTIKETIELSKNEYDALLNRFGKFDVPHEGESPTSTAVFRRERNVPIHDANPAVWRYEQSIVRRSDGKVLGTQVTYGRVGGDFPSPSHSSSFLCPEQSGDVLSAVVRRRKE